MRIILALALVLFFSCSTTQPTKSNLTLIQIEGEINDILEDYKFNLEKNTFWDKDFYEKLEMTRKSFDSIRTKINTIPRNEVISQLHQINKEKCIPMFELDNSWINKIDPTLEDLDLNINIAFNELSFINKAIKIQLDKTSTIFRRMKPLVLVKNNKQTDIYFTALLNDQNTEIIFENIDHEIIYDTLKIIARYSEDHFTIINKQNIPFKALFRIKKIDGSFNNYPIHFPPDK